MMRASLAALYAEIRPTWTPRVRTGLTTNGVRDFGNADQPGRFCAAWRVSRCEETVSDYAFGASVARKWKQLSGSQCLSLIRVRGRSVRSAATLYFSSICFERSAITQQPPHTKKQTATKKKNKTENKNEEGVANSPICF